jgi:DNA polymerase III epsilon subunit-like protein
MAGGTVDFQADKLRELFQVMAGEYGWPTLAPERYMVIDLETTGLERDKDRILQLGLCVVNQGKVKMFAGQNGRRRPFLSQYFRVPPEAITLESIAVNGITNDIIQRHGVAPRAALEKFQSLLQTARRNNWALVGHNLIRFDLPFLLVEAEGLGVRLNFADMPVVDTGMIVKACQLTDHPPRAPVSRYFREIADLPRRGVFYSLDRVCVPQFGLESKGVDPRRTHDAGYDCWVTHLLFQELVRMALS